MTHDDLVGDLEQHRPDLLRIARLQLRDDDLAEDVVQDTLTAALESASTFRGEARVKTWLIGILKFKILDALRQRARAPVPVSTLAAELDTADLDQLFDDRGIWRPRPRAWGDPTSEARQNEFLRVLELCLSKLPPHTARVFMLRELFDLDPEETCRVAAITRNHLNVLLYRARISLRRCLELGWTGAGSGVTS